MFRAIAFIPTILAYSFIVLLVIILGFIVLYVSHKIYGYVYDNLPLVHLNESSAFAQDSSTSSLLKAKDDCVTKRKSKAALRIFVNVEPCHLAYAVIETEFSMGVRYKLEKANNDVSNVEQWKLIKYFDSLSAIPTGSIMKKCSNTTASTVKPFEFNSVNEQF